MLAAALTASKRRARSTISFRETARYYPSIAKTDVRVILIHPERFLLPELGEELGLYAERKLRERRVDVLTGCASQATTARWSR